MPETHSKNDLLRIYFTFHTIKHCATVSHDEQFSFSTLRNVCTFITNYTWIDIREFQNNKLPKFSSDFINTFLLGGNFLKVKKKRSKNVVFKKIYSNI